ncbi:MAG TPA: response regulator transcription factor [Thermoanaerobaculia bacterium]|nr:response regulator transcription factor [Thermoanaerobaculia bacterium]
MIRVCLVEDHTLVRQGIRTLLELAGDMEVVGEASDGEEALALVRASRPEVMLLDVRLPGRNGLEVLRELAAAGEAPPTIVLTTYDDDALALEAVHAGARGFLLKDVSLEELASAIRRVAAGGEVLRPAVTERTLRGLRDHPTTFPHLEPPDPLTPREQAILRLLAGGYSNREMADALTLAEGTVKNHISSILSKLGVRDRTRAVLRGVELGLL